MPSSHLILCCPLLLLPPIPPSIRVFSNESTLPLRWPKYWSFSFSISPSNGHSGLISFGMDWLDLLAVQGTLKSPSYAILLFTALDLASITHHIHNWVLFLLWLHPFILSRVISPLFSSSILGTYLPGEFLFQYPIILPSHTVHGEKWYMWTYFPGRNGDSYVVNGLVDTVGDRVSGTNEESSIDICTLSCAK